MEPRGIVHRRGGAGENPSHKPPRRTEGGEAPRWPGATTEFIGHKRGRSNAVSGDASTAECSGVYEMGSIVRHDLSVDSTCLLLRFRSPPPIEPMLAKLADELPQDEAFLYEPKWDGFRAIVFRGGGEVFIQSRDLRPLDRYFPELHDALLAASPRRLRGRRRDRDRHAARTRLRRAADAAPSRRVARREARAGDARRRSSPSMLLAADGKDLREVAQSERRRRLEQLLARREAADPSDADDARSRDRLRVAVAIRRRRPRRRDREAGRRALSSRASGR